ncbi:energy-coupling factor transporter transmembrane protein EcfT [Cytobacillus pseudoceanisediminis]|uniref:energy-coupling factor transporter transmembrane component T family protein n=1 Tax=Cytobacillus pseudoceanisediminis TaxID=3051614 RepID=UPI00218599FE|nr:energy-coupling factor transporter transmembrane component T [Cytobacillus pseudoceanisediminis]UQX55064.1 energy-coupling factor transporter transmembrane protein EcfT [Cytobacillus pseudoceanisediminis]
MAAIDFVSNLDEETWVHKLDPRAKLCLILGFVIIPLLFMDPLYLTGILLLGMVLWFSAKIKIKPILPLLVTILILAMSAIVFATFYNYNQPDETILFSIGSLQATDVGLYSGLILGYRIGIPCFMTIIIISTTDPALLAKGLMKMKVPINVAFMFLGTLRFFPLVFEELTNISNAQTIRGVNKKGMRGSWNSFKLAVFPLLINSLRKSRTMGLAVESKGFSKMAWKEYYQDMKLKKMDWFAIAFTIIFFAGAIYIRFILGLGGSNSIVYS